MQRLAQALDFLLQPGQGFGDGRLQIDLAPELALPLVEGKRTDAQLLGDLRDAATAPDQSDRMAAEGLVKLSAPRGGRHGSWDLRTLFRVLFQFHELGPAPLF